MEKPKKIELFPCSSKTIDPCIAIINGLFAVVKDEYLIAVDPKSSGSSGKIFKDQATTPQDNESKTFKSFSWTQPISQLGNESPSLLNGSDKSL